MLPSLAILRAVGARRTDDGSHGVLKPPGPIQPAMSSSVPIYPSDQRVDPVSPMCRPFAVLTCHACAPMRRSRPLCRSARELPIFGALGRMWPKLKLARV